MSELNEVIGRNVRAIRASAGVGQRTLVDAAKQVGAPWSGSSVSLIEAGRRRITVEDLIVAASALSQVTGRAITVRDLLADNAEVRVTPAIVLPSASILKVLAGSPLSEVANPRRDLVDVFDPSAQRTALAAAATGIGILEQPDLLRLERFHESDELLRVVRTMPGWDAYMVHLVALRLWGRGFIAERDTRAGDDANAQRRGRVTRELKTELSQWLKENRGDR